MITTARRRARAAARKLWDRLGDLAGDADEVYDLVNRLYDDGDEARTAISRRRLHLLADELESIADEVHS